MNEKGHSEEGSIISVQGSVVDAHFPGQLPSLLSVLQAGDDEDMTIEVVAHLDAQRVRGIALTSTQGLAQGPTIIDTGHFLRVPVGKRVLGRVLNVFGQTLDKKGAVAGGEWRSIHQEPVSSAVRALERRFLSWK